MEVSAPLLQAWVWPKVESPDPQVLWRTELGAANRQLLASAQGTQGSMRENNSNTNIYLCIYFNPWRFTKPSKRTLKT